MKNPSIALITAAAALELDEDLAPLERSLREQATVRIVNWDDPDIDWSTFDLALLRSPWDYTQRLSEFLAWIERAARQTRLLNPADVVRWNTDKHYLRDLAHTNVATVPSEFIEPGKNATALLHAFLEQPCDEFVVKPAIGAGSRDAQRYGRDEVAQALLHAQRLLDAKRSVLLQPYLDRVDANGETALIYFDGEFSHAIRKGPLLRRGEGPTRALFAAEHITARKPSDLELDLARRTLAAIPFQKPLLYARVDLIEGADGSPRVLELELTEPSLFFDHAEGAVERFVEAILARI
jgi:glutathione synthase/RimK-type ligase-like ATP-grasp enzyme